MLNNEGQCTEVKSNIRRLFSIVFESLAKDYEIPRNKLLLETIIGQGQFGDVHRGTYVSPVSSQHNPHPWLAQLVEGWTAVREVEGLSPKRNQHSGS